MSTNFISDLFVTTPLPGFSLQTSEKSPLSDLYKNRYDLASYHYPRDLASNPGRNHYIVFQTLEVSPKSPTPEQVSNVGTTMKNLGVETYDQLKQIIDNPQLIKDRILNTRIEGLMSIPNMTRDDAVNLIKKDQQGFLASVNEAYNAVADFGATLISGQPNTTAKESIALYIPDTVNVQYSANYSDVSTTEALGKPYMYAQIGASLMDKYKQATSGASPSSIVSNVLSDPVLRGFLASKISGKAGLGDLTGLSLNAIAYAFNPQLQVLFSNIGFRSFQFDFTFTPYNQEEAQAVKNIIQTFKYRAAPTIETNGVFAQSLYQKIPDRFKIKFFQDNRENTNLHRIGECVLTGMNVDYASTGSWIAYADGSPVQTKLTLQFQEIEIIDKNKIGAPGTSGGGY